MWPRRSQLPRHCCPLASHDRFVFCPSINHPCFTWASSSGSSSSSARRASHGNACHASQSQQASPAPGTVDVGDPGTARRASSPDDINIASLPIAAAAAAAAATGQPPPVILPLRPSWVCHLYHVVRIVLLSPPGGNRCKTRVKHAHCTGVRQIPPHHRKPPRVIKKKAKR